MHENVNLNFSAHDEFVLKINRDILPRKSNVHHSYFAHLSVSKFDACFDLSNRMSLPKLPLLVSKNESFCFSTKSRISDCFRFAFVCVFKALCVEVVVMCGIGYAFARELPPLLLLQAFGVIAFCFACHYRSA